VARLTQVSIEYFTSIGESTVIINEESMRLLDGIFSYRRSGKAISGNSKPIIARVVARE
jgi:hypothetical protein